MAKLTKSQKGGKVLRFLRGVARPRAATPLASFGFTQADLDEGWHRLHTATGDKLLVVPSGKPDPTKLRLLDEWENLWFPIADATLRHRFPEVHAKVFLNLTQQTGQDVLISVKAFVSRVDALETGSQEEKDARALLEQRGLDAGRMDEAKTLLAQVATIETPEPQVPDPAALEAAEKAMWDWYLEWSAIARTAIKDRRTLRSLGFLRSRSSAGVDDATDDVTDEDADEGDDDDQPDGV